MKEIFHAGEKRIQQLTGEEIAANSNGRIISGSIIKGAVKFIEKQPLIIVSSSDEKSKVWTSALMGDFGFIKVPDTRTIFLDRGKMVSNIEDIFFSNIDHNPQIGILFIELITRRRYRINGIASLENSLIRIDIDEAYPNCPKYVQRRAASLLPHSQQLDAQITTGTQLGGPEKDWISQADTFFVGSKSTNGSTDASHRGGNPGFIELKDNVTLRIPDYQGNSMYNTLGNIYQNPQAGLLFIDFEKGRTLQLTGTAEIEFDHRSNEDLEKSNGTGRFWFFHVEHWILSEKHHTIDWQFIDYSPFNP